MARTKASKAPQECCSVVTGASVKPCVSYTEDSITLNNRFQIFDTLCDMHTAYNKVEDQYDLNLNSNLCTGDTDQEYQKQDSNQVVHQSFGFNPTGPLKLYTGDPVYYETIPDIIKTHRTVRDSAYPNFLKC